MKSRRLALDLYVKALHQSGNLTILERVEFLHPITKVTSKLRVNGKNSVLIHPNNEAPAELLYVAAISNLKGYGLKINRAKYNQLLNRSANKGFGVAQFSLANTYLGNDVQKTNMSMYFYWLLKAVENKHAQATYQLATLYLSTNSLVSKNKTRAIKLLIESARLGNKDAEKLHKSITRS